MGPDLPSGGAIERKLGLCHFQTGDSPGAHEDSIPPLTAGFDRSWEDSTC